MYSVSQRLALSLCLAFMAGMSPRFARGQAEAGSSSAPQEVFSLIHQDLSEAADRSLTAVLADQKWMSLPSASTNPTDPRRIGKTPTLMVRAAIDCVNELRPTLEPLLRSESIPVELSAVVLVESRGLTAALSPKGAQGLWQFMPDTARRFGLVVDSLHDERTDVVKSPHAAARYLRELYSMFGDWRLALAAYSAGESVISKAISRSGSSDFELVRERGGLPLETRNYVPEVAAAMNSLCYESLSLDSRRTMSEPNAQIVYASADQGSEFVRRLNYENQNFTSSRTQWRSHNRDHSAE